MADIESNIGINIDTSGALSAIKNLQRQISAFQSSMSAGNAKMQADAAGLQKDLINNINATGKFSAGLTRIKTTTESFTNALEKNKLTMGEYFRYSAAASKNFSRGFGKELSTIDKVARERVKDLQSQYIKLGRDASGAVSAIRVRPLVLDMNDLGTKTQIAAQKQQIFNQLLKQGSTNLLNFGKNTQWAGRQLMVGFTIPLTIFGTQASKIFMDLERQAIKFRRVYGDLFTSPEETDKVIKDLQALALEFTKYGVAVTETMEQAASAAAMGKTGVDLIAQVSEATRLSVLGNVEQAQALETTISLTNAFGIASEDLASKIDFLNAVENQTVTAIEDLTIAIPKAAPVIQQLGGNVEELAFFLTAMKEGGINASEGANALKSGLASLINPTGKASEMLKGFGINIKSIVDANKGDVKGLVIDFATALDQLEPLKRAQAIEQLFGKFQFARLSTLFQNVIQEGTQAQRVLELTNATTADLARLSEKELGSVAESTTFKFEAAVERLRVAIAPVGEQFLKAITPIIEFAADLVNKFNAMGDGIKNFAVIGTTILAGLGPVFLMLFGLVANGVANIIKGFAAVRGLFLKTKDSSQILGEQFDYMTQEQIEAASVAASLERAHMQLQQRFSSEALAVEKLIDVYQRATVAQNRFGGSAAKKNNDGMKLASGIVSVPGPKGAGDIVPAMLSPGEAVIPADAARKYAPLIQGMISDNIPGFNKGVMLGMPRSAKGVQKDREAADQIYQQFLKSSYANVPPTNYGHQLSPTSGHSFPIFGLGGVYMGPDGQKVFVKPVMDEKAALAEMRGTQIARQAHGLKAPEQRIVVMRDPKDVTGTRRFLALESKLDSTFVNTDPMAVFNEDQYFKQLVASLVRVDKDLAAGNLFGDVVADVGPAGVFNRASGVRDYTTDLPSMEQQALINLLGIKGGAKKAFAESTVGLMSSLTPQQYHQKMISEIQQVLPMLKQTIAGFKLTDPAEVEVYNAMVKRLEQGLGVDWTKFHAIHSAVKPSAPKQSAKPIAKYADGVVSVPGPKGAGDIVPAMLSPGEAVIPAKKAKKYAPLINAMIAGNIPGYEQGLESGGRASSLRTYTDFTAGLSRSGNAALNTGTAIPSEIAGEFRLNPEAIQGPLIAYLAEQLYDATTQTQIKKALDSDPSIEQYARSLSLTIADEVASTTAERMSDPDFYSAVSSAVAKTPAPSNIASAVSKIASEQTTFEDDTVLRQRSSGRLQAMGRERLTSDRGRFSTVGNRGLAMSQQRYGKVLSDPVLAHLTRPVDTPLSSISSMSNLSRQAQAALGRKQRGEQEIRTSGKSIVVPSSATPEQKRQAVEAGKSIVEDIGQELSNAAQTNSPSKKTKAAAQGMVDGVVETIKSGAPKVAKATGASFVKPIQAPTSQSGYIPRPVAAPSQAQSVAVAKEAAGMSMSPLRAYFTVVGANLREVVQDFKSEVGIVSRDSMGPLEAYLTTVRANLRDVWTDSKAEFSAIFNGPGIAQAGQTAAQKFRQGLDQAHPQLIIDGVEAGRDYAAALNGQHGGIAAVLTKKNAELISSATKAWNNGIRELPKQGQSMFKIAGGMVSEEIASSIIDRTRQLAPAVAGAVADPAKAKNSRIGSGPMGTVSYDMLNGRKLQTQDDSSSGMKTLGDRLSDVNTKMMAFSGTFSSLGMMAAMAGDSLGGMGEQIYQLSNTFFMLTGIIQLLNSLELTRIKNLKISNVTDFFSAMKTGGINSFKELRNSAIGTAKVFSGGLKGSIGNIGKLFGSLGSKIMGLGGGLGRLIPVVGAAVGAFQLISMISDAQKKREDEIAGLGRAASLTASDIAMLGEVAGIAINEIKTNSGGVTSDTNVEGLSSKEVAEAGVSLDQAYSENAELKAFIDQVSTSVKAATDPKVIESTMASMALNLQSKGFDPAFIAATVAKISDVSGKNIDTTFLSKAFNEETNQYDISSLRESAGNVFSILESSAKEFNAAAAVQAETARNQEQDFTYVAPTPVPDAPTMAQLQQYATAAGASAGTQLGSLEPQFMGGQISIEELGTQADGLIYKLREIDIAVRDIAIDEAMSSFVENTGKSAEDAAIISKLNAEDRLLLLEAFARGETVDTAQLQALEAGGKGAIEVRDSLNTKIAQSATNLTKEKEALDRVNVGLEEQADLVDYADVNGQTAAISGLTKKSEEFSKIAKDNLGINLSEAAARELLTDTMWEEKLAQAELLDAQKGGTENVEALISAYNDYQNALVNSDIDAAIAQLEADNAVKEKLAESGLDAATSADILASSMWSSAFAAAATAEDFQAVLDKYNQFIALGGKEKPSGGGGGSREQTPFEQAIEQLQNQRKEILNNKKAYAGLRDEGFSVSEAFDAANDSTLAAALASEKVGSAKWEKLVKLAKDYNKELLKMDIAELTRRNNIEIETINNTFKIREGLEEAGYSAETIERAIEQIGDNPEILAALAKDLEDGKVNARNMVDLLKSIDGIEIAIKLKKTPSELRDEALEAIGVLNNYFNAQEQVIRNAFRTGSEVAMDLDNDAKTVDIKVNTGKINIAQLEKDIAEAEEYIASRQFQIDDYQYGLDAIAKQEEGINKKYDKRIEALDKVASLNSKISEGQRSQLDVATALASGDIAAAARAMQEDEARRAQEAVDQQKESIEAAREKEMAALSATVNGTKLTRVQLEEKISTLQDEIAKKEEDTLEPKQRALDLANKQIDSLVSSITYAGKNRDAWVEIEGKIALANIELGKYMDMLKKIADGTFKFGDEKFTGPTNTVAAPTPKSLTGSTTYGNLELRAKDPKAFAEARAKEEEALLKRDDIGPKARAAAEKRLESYNQVVKNASAGGQILKKQMGGFIKRYVLGGDVSGFSKGRYSMGTDIVPAMLTPGEFVVRKYAVDKFGVDNLKAINRGEFKTGSVYNYSVNVNVSTDADPDRIARAVMTEIRRSESQRIRRF